jgi:uncharacterized protein (TIGR00369 family)
MNRVRVLDIYNRLHGLPLGNRIFSRVLCMKAPYFKSIKPVFSELREGYCEIRMKKRRSVENHLKSVHAIAMANLCELTGGTCLEASIPGSLRWIAKGMNIEYLKIAKTGLTARCEIVGIPEDKTGDFPVTIRVDDQNGVMVVKAVINMYISRKKSG